MSNSMLWPRSATPGVYLAPAADPAINRLRAEAAERAVPWTARLTFTRAARSARARILEISAIACSGGDRYIADQADQLAEHVLTLDRTHTLAWTRDDAEACAVCVRQLGDVEIETRGLARLAPPPPSLGELQR